jgi:hypothetical protein
LVPLLLRTVDSGRFKEVLKVKKERNCMLNAGLDISSGEVKHATARAQVKFNPLHTCQNFKIELDNVDMGGENVLIRIYK